MSPIAYSESGKTDDKRNNCSKKDLDRWNDTNDIRKELITNIWKLYGSQILDSIVLENCGMGGFSDKLMPDLLEIRMKMVTIFDTIENKKYKDERALYDALAVTQSMIDGYEAGYRHFMKTHLKDLLPKNYCDYMTKSILEKMNKEMLDKNN